MTYLKLLSGDQMGCLLAAEAQHPHTTLPASNYCKIEVEQSSFRLRVPVTRGRRTIAPGRQGFEIHVRPAVKNVMFQCILHFTTYQAIAAVARVCCAVVVIKPCIQ